VLEVSTEPAAKERALPQWLQIPFISIVPDCSPKYDPDVGIGNKCIQGGDKPYVDSASSYLGTIRTVLTSKETRRRREHLEEEGQGERQLRD